MAVAEPASSWFHFRMKKIDQKEEENKKDSVNSGEIEGNCILLNILMPIPFYLYFFLICKF